MAHPGVAIVAGLSLFAALGGCGGGGSSSQLPSPPSKPPISHDLKGTVASGNAAISGAIVVAYGAGTTAGAEPVELGIAHSDVNGVFAMNFSPKPASGQTVYLTVHGGNAGKGSNAALGLMSVIGAYCEPAVDPRCTFPPAVTVNELTTTASTAALHRYIRFADCVTMASNTRTGRCLTIVGARGLAQATKTVENLVDIASGKPSDFLAAQPATTIDPIHVTLQKLDTLASVLAACANSSGTATDPSATCRSLFAVIPGRPETTFQAAWEIAAWPGANAKGRALMELLPERPAYRPVLSSAPDNWTIAGGRFAWASDMVSGKLSAWRLSPLTGVLVPLRSGGATACSTSAVPLSPDPANCFAAGDSPSALALGLAGRFLWVVNRSDGTIATWAVDPATGALVREDSSLVDDAGPRALAVDAPGSHLYVANHDDATVGVYGINPTTGELSRLTAVATGSAPRALAMSLDGRNLYVVDAGSGDISAYAVGPDGALDALAGSPFTAGVEPVSLAISPDGQYLYAANAGSRDVSAYAIGAQGVLEEVAGSPFAAGNGPAAVAVSGNGHYVYVANENSTVISAFAVDSGGRLVPIAGSPFAVGDSPVAVDAAGSRLYAVNRAGNDVSTWTIVQEATSSGTAAGALVPLDFAAPYPSGLHTDAVVVDPTGRYVWAVNSNCHDPQRPCAGTTGSVSAWRLDPVSGALIPVAGSPFAAGVSPELLAVSPDGRSVYVANCGAGGEDGVTAYAVNDRDGALLTVGDYPLAAGACPYGITVSPNGSHVYTADYAASAISVFSRNADGSLDFVETAPVSGSGALSVAITPNGRYLYVTNNKSANVSAYALDPGTDLPNAEVTGSPFPASSSTDWIAIDPVAPYAYAVNFFTDNLSGYRIGAGGKLTPVPGSPIAVGTGRRPRAVAVAPFGRYAYVANHTGDDVSAWRILADGSLQGVPGSPFPAGNEPLAITVDPSGRYVYTANHSANDVSAFRIGANGALAPIMASSPFPAGSGPEAIVIGP